MKKRKTRFLLFRVKASAMYFAILVAILVGLILASFLLLTYTFKNYHFKSKEIFNDLNTIEKEIDALVISAENKHPESKSQIVSEKKFWGGFGLLIFNLENGFGKAVLLGGEANDYPANIYLADNKLPLVVAGNAKLEGIGFVPKNLIKAGSIDGNFYINKELIYGASYSSENYLPEVSINWREYIENIYMVSPRTLGETIELSNVSNSFFNTTRVIFSKDELLVRHRLQGNIIIKSDKKITITNSSDLDQVIVIAPKVVVQKGFRGNIHIISNEVDINRNSYLEYPSSVIVTENQLRESRKPRILIQENSVIKGNIVAFEKSKPNKSKDDISVAENVQIEGSIYCEGYLDLRGRVLGNVFSWFFATHKNGSIYINHLYDGKILKHYENLGGILLEGNNKIRAKWLY